MKQIAEQTVYMCLNYISYIRMSTEKQESKSMHKTYI